MNLIQGFLSVFCVNYLIFRLNYITKNLAVYSFIINNENFIDMVIPGKNLLELIKMLDDEDEKLEMHLFSNKVLFKYKNTIFLSRLLSGTYPTNSSETVTSKIDGNNESVTSNLTPILSDKYAVTYDGNAPQGCNVSNVPNTESKSVFTTVKISENKPVCDGYIFKKWEVVTEGVTMVNDDYFIMPEADVTIRAVWSKLSLTKDKLLTTSL